LEKFAIENCCPNHHHHHYQGVMSQKMLELCFDYNSSTIIITIAMKEIIIMIKLTQINRLN